MQINNARIVSPVLEKGTYAPALTSNGTICSTASVTLVLEKRRKEKEDKQKRIEEPLMNKIQCGAKFPLPTTFLTMGGMHHPWHAGLFPSDHHLGNREVSAR